MNSGNVELDKSHKHLRIKSLMNLGLLLFGGMVIGFSPHLYINHNAYHKGKDEEVARKLDGLVNSTTVTILEGEGGKLIPKININRYSFSGDSLSYSDFDGDYFVDRITECPSGVRVVSLYDRTEDLEKYPDKFKTADADFKKQMKRFEPLFKRNRET